MEKLQLHLNCPNKKLWSLLKPYCTSFISNEPKKGFNTLNLNILDILDYSSRKSFVIDEDYPIDILYLHNDLNYLYNGNRNDVAGRIEDQFPDLKFGLLDITTGINEIKVFNDHVKNKLVSVITSYPISIGIFGRTLDEVWPQLKEPTKEDSPASYSWLEYVARTFKEEFDKIK